MSKPINMSVLLPKSLHSAAAWLGRSNWLTPPEDLWKATSMSINFPAIDKGISSDEYFQVKRVIADYYRQGGFPEIIQFYTVSKLLAGGIKVFRPTIQQCEAMNQISVDIPIREYQQPYPAILFEYPIEFCRSMSEQLGCKRFPIVSLCHHDLHTKFIIVSSYFDEGDAVFASIPPKDQTIESILSYPANKGVKANEDDREFRLGEVLQRIAINFSLLMTQYRVGHKPLDPGAAAHHRQMMKANNPARKEKGRLLSLTDASIISFDQNIQFYEERQERTNNPNEVTNDSNRHVRPHWRKGHWRMQAHGPQHSERKRLFIKPLMVKKSMFVGNFADTSVIYEGKK